MNNKIKEEMKKIEIPENVRERSKKGVAKAQSEMPKRKMYSTKGISIAASLFILFGSYGAYKLFSQSDSNDNGATSIVTAEGGLHLPAIQIPENDESASMMSMIGLVVYNGKIYTQTGTTIDSKNAKNFLGEKLGTSKASIDEWSKQDEYAVEFASTIGEMDVYSVKGYDKDFRIMSFFEHEGEVYSEFLESLNGITIHDGEDVFGKLKMVGNIENAQYRNFDDWNYSVDNHHQIDDMKILNSFIEELNHTVPLSYESVEELLGDFRNEEQYKDMTLFLKDGSKVSLVVIKDGYIRYGYSNLYFKMDNEVFNEMWGQLTSN